MMMAHRTDGGSAMPSGTPTPQPDPGDPDLLRAGFDQTVPEAYRKARGQFWRRIGWVFVAVFLALWLAFTICPAAAQQMMPPGPPCAKRADIVEQLDKRYGELQRGIGLQGNGSLFELFRSEASGTWTIVVTKTNGISCVMAAGDGWESMPEPKSEDPPA